MSPDFGTLSLIVIPNTNELLYDSMMHPPVSRASLPIPAQIRERQSSLEPVNSGLLYQNDIFEDAFEDIRSSVRRCGNREGAKSKAVWALWMLVSVQE